MLGLNEGRKFDDTGPGRGTFEVGDCDRHCHWTLPRFSESKCLYYTHIRTMFISIFVAAAQSLCPGLRHPVFWVIFVAFSDTKQAL